MTSVCLRWLVSTCGFASLLAGCGAGTPPPPPLNPAPQPTHVIVQADYNLYTVPLTGGEVVKLGGDTLPCAFIALAEGRVFYLEYPNWDFPKAWSVRVDGGGRIALAPGDTTEQLVGVIGDRAIVEVRSGLTPDPSLPTVLSVPLQGGPTIDLGPVAGTESKTWGLQVDGQPMVWNAYRLLAVRPDGIGLQFLAREAAPRAVKDGWVGLDSADDTVAAVRLDGSGFVRFPLVLTFATSGGFGYGPAPNPFFAWGEMLFTAVAVDTPSAGQATWGIYAWTPDASSTEAPRAVLQLVGEGLLIWDVVGSTLVARAESVADGTFRFFAVDLIDASVAELLPGVAGSQYVGQGGGSAAFLVPGPASTWNLVAARFDGNGVFGLAEDVKPGLRDDSPGASADPMQRAVAWMGGRFLFRQAVAGRSELRSIRADGTDLVTLTRGEGDKRAWAIAGTSVVYGRTAGTQSDLYAVEIDGTDHRALAETADDETVGVVAGATVVYTRVTGSSRDLFAVPLAGGNSVQLTSGFTYMEPVAFR